MKIITWNSDSVKAARVLGSQATVKKSSPWLAHLNK